MSIHRPPRYPNNNNRSIKIKEWTHGVLDSTVNFEYVSRGSSSLFVTYTILFSLRSVFVIVLPPSPIPLHQPAHILSFWLFRKFLAIVFTEEYAMYSIYTIDLDILYGVCSRAKVTWWRLSRQQRGCSIPRTQAH